MQGKWIRPPQTGVSIVFVHGILSSGETCWKHKNGTYWPSLLADEEKFKAYGVYVYTYETGIFSGTYDLNNVVDDLKERIFTLDKVAESHRIVFVCHSMGGIVVRKFLVERVLNLIDKNIEIGLFLVASPSVGASYANWLTPIAKFMGHSQADALRFSQSNSWLNGLDKEFQNLKESGRLRLCGKELIEDKFVVLSKFWRKQVVEPFAGARYFGEHFKVPGSDHFTIAKPENAESVQHRLLLAFLEKMANPELHHASEHRSSPPNTAEKSQYFDMDRKNPIDRDVRSPSHSQNDKLKPDSTTSTPFMGKSEISKPMAHGSVKEMKRKALELRIKDLVDDYQAATESLSYIISAVDRERVMRQIQVLEKELEQVECELAMLG